MKFPDLNLNQKACLGMGVADCVGAMSVANGKENLMSETQKTSDMSETGKASALAKKLVAAMKAIDAVEKRGHNEKQNYGYVKATDVAKAVRAVLVDQGIAFNYSTLGTERWEKQTNSGGTLFFVELAIQVTFTDMESGEEKTVNGIGWGMDSGDKAIYKAMTGALKYVLRMNYLIPDELDPENDSEDHGNTNGASHTNGNGHKPEVKRVSQAKVEAPPAAKGSKDVSGDDAITEGKVKRFKACVFAGGKDWDEVGEKLASVGLSSIEHCPWKGELWKELCAWAEGK